MLSLVAPTFTLHEKSGLSSTIAFATSNKCRNCTRAPNNRHPESKRPPRAKLPVERLLDGPRLPPINPEPKMPTRMSPQLSFSHLLPLTDPSFAPAVPDSGLLPPGSSTRRYRCRGGHRASVRLPLLRCSLPGGSASSCLESERSTAFERAAKRVRSGPVSPSSVLRGWRAD